MAESPETIPPQRGDEEQLFRTYDKRLRRATQLAVRTSPEIVDDACAHAWMKLLSHQPRRETAFAWLKAVARNEALRLERLQRRLVTVDRGLDESPAVEPVAQRASVETAQGLLEVRERLEELPERLREIVFLSAAGWRYKELADRTGVSVPRVGQLIAQAGSRLREIDIREHDATSPRSLRLRELENEPPRYVLAAIGRLPSPNRRGIAEETRREWRRLALAIDKFRDDNHVTDPFAALGSDALAPGRDDLARRIADYRAERGLSRGFEL